ncbi:MAG: hypothetical protein ACREAR_03425 [Nitrosotalea sp.]
MQDAYTLAVGIIQYSIPNNAVINPRHLVIIFSALFEKDCKITLVDLTKIVSSQNANSYTT